MVIDTSALLAVLLNEEDSGRYRAAVAADPTRLLSAANELEAFIVVECKFGPEGVRELDLLLSTAQIETVPVTTDQTKFARDGYRRFGRGPGKKALNFGDCFAYALAKSSTEPLLFKGDDFAATDIDSVL